MEPELQIRKLDPTDRKRILNIADWYYKEWNTPIEKTVNRLSSQPNDDIFFQLIVSIKGKSVATGGLCNNVNLLKVYPEFRKLGPWVALLYTHHEFRHKGIGKALLEHIELHARTFKLEKIYLYTYTAESFYRRAGWKSIETIKYKDHDTVIMEKEIT